MYIKDYSYILWNILASDDRWEMCLRQRSQL